jgi:SpoVK/Ycf46/Vps4 family AAA+-type ATPase
MPPSFLLILTCTYKTPRFMTHWDGLASTSSTGSTTPQRICILGATNRIQDIDEAILRRMPKKFPVALPSSPQRHNIFSLILRGTKIDRPNFDMDYLVRVSAGMSGSDIKEACRDAAMGPVREYIRKMKKEGKLRGGRGVDPDAVRGLRTEDFFGRNRGLREAEELDDVKDEIVNTKEGSRRIHTTEESEDGGSSTESGEENFRDSAYQDADATPVR